MKWFIVSACQGPIPGTLTHRGGVAGKSMTLAWIKKRHRTVDKLTPVFKV